MKKLIALGAAAILIACPLLFSCSSNEGESAEQNASTEQQMPAPTPAPQQSGEAEPTPGADDTTEGKVLVAYFTRTGATDHIASVIHREVGGDLVKLETVQTYPEDYDEMLEVGTEEKNAAARPELATTVDNMDEYDTIYLGYPIWWGDTPMAILTFLESYDFSGKTIIAFCTYGSSGFSNSINSIESSAPGATVVQGFGTSNDSATSADDEVLAWLASLSESD